MSKLQKLELLKDAIQQAIDRGASSVEQVHQHIADLPFEFLERAGLLKADKLALREKKRRTIGMVYDAIRGINRQIGEMISDQFENLEDTHAVSRVIDERQMEEKRAATPARPRAPVRKPAAAAKKAAARKTPVKKVPAKKAVARPAAGKARPKTSAPKKKR